MSENTYKIDKGEFLKYQVLTKAHEIPIAECSMEYEANRVMASLNACNGISTEALEAGVVADLLEAAEAVFVAWEANNLFQNAPLMGSLFAIIAKAKGK